MYAVTVGFLWKCILFDYIIVRLQTGLRYQLKNCFDKQILPAMERLFFLGIGKLTSFQKIPYQINKIW